MKKLSILFLLITGILTYSCSDDEDTNVAEDNTPTVTSLDLTSDFTEGMLDSTFTFTVNANYSDDTIVDVTTSSTFTVNNESISNPFTPTEPGVYTVTSTFNDASTTLDITVTAPPTTYLEFDFDDATATGWTFIDNDGDGFQWSVSQIVDTNSDPVGTALLRSASWDGTASAALTPDNFAISPAIDLSAEDGNRMITLSWDVTAADPAYAAENYTVYAATENTITGLTSSSVNFNEIVTDNGPGGLDNVYTKTLDLTALAGSVVYVAFRHHDVTDQFTIEIDNISVIAGSDTGRVSSSKKTVGNIDGVLLKEDLAN